MFPYQLP